MREILFRGKLKQNNGDHRKGDWVHGDFVRLHDGNKQIPCIYGFGEVIPETVGQYTGLTDKNGTKIFEGDVVEYKNGSFVRNHGRRNNPYLQNGGLSKIIGNIHDNPELLDGTLGKEMR